MDLAKRPPMEQLNDARRHLSMCMINLKDKPDFEHLRKRIFDQVAALNRLMYDVEHKQEQLYWRMVRETCIPRDDLKVGHTYEGEGRYPTAVWNGTQFACRDVECGHVIENLLDHPDANTRYEWYPMTDLGIVEPQLNAV